MKNKFILLGLLATLLTTSCGIFKKGCDCPKFGQIKNAVKAMA